MHIYSLTQLYHCIILSIPFIKNLRNFTAKATVLVHSPTPFASPKHVLYGLKIPYPVQTVVFFIPCLGQHN